jgi:acylphosphatase
VRERRNVKIRGLVQGVFFRDTVRRIALRYQVAGFVRNVDRDIVEIEAEGEPATVAAFLEDVVAHPPPHARVQDVQAIHVPAQNEDSFRVAPSLRN